jgi:hypothetical protein
MTDKNRNTVPDHLREDGSEGYQPRSNPPRPYQRDVEFYRDYDSSSSHWLTDQYGNPIGGPRRNRGGDY